MAPVHPGGAPVKPLVVAALGTFLAVLEATIVSVALPDIRADLGFSLTDLPWAVNAYSLAYAGFLLLGGRCADMFGNRATMITGAVLFAVTLVICGLATGPAMLLAARAAGGLGSALLVPVTLNVITSAYPEGPPRARAVGALSAVGTLAAASGPMLGGVLTQLAGWRWVFLVMVLPACALVIGAARILPKRNNTAPRSVLDLPGALLVTCGLLALVYGVTQRSLYIGLAGPVLLAVFYRQQARSRRPLLPVAILHTRSVWSGNLTMLLLGLGFFASPVLFSLNLQYGYGFSPMSAGLGFLPVAVAMWAGARTAGPLTGRWGPRRSASFGCLVGATGYAALGLTLDPHIPYWISVLLPGIVFGYGVTFAFTPITVAAVAGVPATHGGAASGLLNTVRQTTTAVGLALLSTVSTTLAGPHPTPDSLSHGYAMSFLVCAGFLAAATISAWMFIPGRHTGTLRTVVEPLTKGIAIDRHK
ncbi:MFS transporter [Pseudonocardiaceae bacterium YIM PH 21723]|nr:MFS transporter [Pseudonocardiaceae bacterium YIM PH 21723]